MAVEIRYTHHARLKLQERMFTEEQVQRCIEEPDQVLSSAVTAREHSKIVEGRRMRVIFAERQTYYLVITVMEERV